MDEVVTVYQVRYWDFINSVYDYPEKMYPADFVARTNGMSIIDGSDRKVKASELDDQGAYVPPKSA